MMPSSLHERKAYPVIEIFLKKKNNVDVFVSDHYLVFIFYINKLQKDNRISSSRPFQH